MLAMQTNGSSLLCKHLCVFVWLISLPFQIANIEKIEPAVKGICEIHPLNISLI
jgi:hypothetical protein